MGTNIRAVLFDFGGVLAEEGFREGLKAIGSKNGLDPEECFRAGAETAYDTGYVIGAVDETEYWNQLRSRTGITGSDSELRHELLSRFILRPWMMETARSVRKTVQLIGILSDQSNWLDELDERYDFFKEFDYVFNSYYEGNAKRDASFFTQISNKLELAPSDILFFDDNAGHIERAESVGMHARLFEDRDKILRDLSEFGISVSLGS
jgi:putative hydrolase of the HAD superfamily